MNIAKTLPKGLFPGLDFPLAERGAALFFSFYWVMTGAHAVHVTCGLIALSRLQIASRAAPAWLAGSASEEATALYWHLVDVIWIVLYPILYLGGARIASKPRKASPWQAFRGPLAVWLALCLLLAATCAIAYVPLGAANLPISLVIAATKAALVGGIFMRLRTDTPLNRLAAGIGPAWIAIMFLLVFADYATR